MLRTGDGRGKRGERTTKPFWKPRDPATSCGQLPLLGRVLKMPLDECLIAGG